MAILQLLELGTSSAFYTFLSNRPQGLRFLVSYMLWQLFQLVRLGIGFAFGWLAFNLAGSISSYLSLNIIWKFGISLVMYGTFSALYLWNFPGMAGLSRPEMGSFIVRFVFFIQRVKKILAIYSIKCS